MSLFLCDRWRNWGVGPLKNVLRVTQPGLPDCRAQRCHHLSPARGQLVQWCMHERVLSGDVELISPIVRNTEAGEPTGRLCNKNLGCPFLHLRSLLWRRLCTQHFHSQNSCEGAPHKMHCDPNTTICHSKNLEGVWIAFGMRHNP